MLYLGNSFGLEAFFLQNGALLSGILCVGQSMLGDLVLGQWLLLSLLWLPSCTRDGVNVRIRIGLIFVSTSIFQVLIILIYQDLQWWAKVPIFGKPLRRVLNLSRGASSRFVTVVRMPYFGRTLRMVILPFFLAFPNFKLFAIFLLMLDGSQWSTLRWSNEWVNWR